MKTLAERKDEFYSLRRDDAAFAAHYGADEVVSWVLDTADITAEDCGVWYDIETYGLPMLHQNVLGYDAAEDYYLETMIFVRPDGCWCSAYSESQLDNQTITHWYSVGGCDVENKGASK